MEDQASFIIGRKGTVFLVRENGTKQKCGFRVREGHIEVFERRTSQWHVLPEMLVSRDGKVITLMVLTE